MFRKIVLIIVTLLNVTFAQSSLPKNIIFLIGDGMGINAVGAALLKVENNPFTEFKSIGLSLTSSSNKLITESAAGATALATGYRTNNYSISIDSSGNRLETLLEFAETKGLATGVVVTSSITHATPGAFLGHTSNRKYENDIAYEIAENKFNVLIGGGRKFFIPKTKNGERDDELNLIKKMTDDGYSFVDDFQSLESTPDSINLLLAMLADDGLPEAGTRDFSQGDLVHKAIKIMSKDSTGFVLIVEGSQIDWALHDHKTEQFFKELNDFISAVRVSLEFAKENGNTLVLVTADHETGGFSLVKGDKNGDNLEVGYSTTNHTASPVGVFAYGPGEDNLRGIFPNYQIGRILFKLIDPSKEF